MPTPRSNARIIPFVIDQINEWGNRGKRARLEPEAVPPPAFIRVQPGHYAHLGHPIAPSSHHRETVQLWGGITRSSRRPVA
jgi:hypothetical protein